MNPPKPVVSTELTPYKVTANGVSYVFLSVHTYVSGELTIPAPTLT